jgi:propionyl-CoA synthetase
VATRGDQPAVIHDSPVTNSKEIITYRQLQERVSRFAGALKDLGVTKGDRVIVYMPMVPEALIAMLGCARIGAIHSVVFGGFSARELATRIDDAKPKVMVAGSCGIETNRVVQYKPLLDEAINIAEHKPEHCIIYQRPQEPGTLVPGHDIGWAEAVAAAQPADCVPVAATDPLYILYTSGTTGIPKGVVRDNGGHAVALAWSMGAIYNIKPGEVWWSASDVGWVVGHSYIVYAPLLIGATTIVYEGKPVGTPDAGAFWRVIEEHGVKALFTAPTAFRAIKRDDPNAEQLKRYNLKGFRTLFLAGERCDPDTLQWAERILKVPVIDHWWQTETGWAIAANCTGIELLPVKPGSPTCAVPGYDIQVLDEEGETVKPGDIGRIMIKLPMPPGCLPTLWNNDERFVQSYLAMQPGYYLTGDAGYIDEDGYVYVMSRIDDIINVAGHRLSTGAMEGVLSSHPDVAECAVIGAADQLKGELPLGLVVLKNGVDRDPAVIRKELVDKVREDIGPVAAFKTVVIVSRLPKTRSGKTLRGTMKSIADGKEYKVPATIDDPAILDEIAAALEGIGYAKHG